MSRLGSYDLIETLGAGPHGAAYLGVEPTQGRSHALKVYESLAGQSVDALQALLEPLQAIRSPYLARVITAGALNGVPFVAREYVAGVTLADLRRAGRGFEAAAAVGVLDTVARGLSAFHAAGQPHGNVSLTNLLIARTGELRLADPALLSRLPREPGTVDEALISGRWGSPTLLAPEVLAGGAPTPASDVFALGALGYWLLTDRWPWPKSAGINSLSALEAAREALNLEPLEPLPTTVPAALRQLIHDALHLSPAARPRDLAGPLELTARELGVDPEDALADCASSLAVAFFSASRLPPPAQLQVGAAEAPRAQPARPAARSEEAPTSLPGSYALADERKARSSLEAPMLDVRTAPEVAVNGGQPAWVGWAMTTLALGAIGAAAYWYSRRDAAGTETPRAAVAQDGAEPAQPEALTQARAAAKASDDEALTAALRAVQELPRSGEAHLLLARAQVRKGRLDAAAESAITAADLMPQSVEAQRYAVERLLAVKRTADALRRAQAACEAHGSDALLHALRGRALLAEGQQDEAATALSLAVDLDPAVADTLVELGEVQLRRARWSAARDAFQRAIALAPKSGRAFAGLGNALVGLGRGGEAVETLKRGLDIAADRDAVQFAIGWVLLRDGKDSEALEYLRPYAVAHPDDARASFALGLAQHRLGHHAEAVEALKQSVALVPEQPEAWFDLGMAQLDLGRTDDALQSLHRASEQRFGLWQAHCERGRLLYRLGRHEDALPGLQNALELHPGLAIAEGLMAVPKGSTLGEMIAAAPCGATVLLPE